MSKAGTYSNTVYLCNCIWTIFVKVIGFFGGLPLLVVSRVPLLGNEAQPVDRFTYLHLPCPQQNDLFDRRKPE